MKKIALISLAAIAALALYAIADRNSADSRPGTQPAISQAEQAPPAAIEEAQINNPAEQMPPPHQVLTKEESLVSASNISGVTAKENRAKQRQSRRAPPPPLSPGQAPDARHAQDKGHGHGHEHQVAKQDAGHNQPAPPTGATH